jgi:hypothetical protein
MKISKTRLDLHLQRNEERKLDDESRRLKTISKWKHPSETKVEVSGELYLIEPGYFGDNSGLLCFKIKKNAQQLHISGCFIYGSASVSKAIVYVEGSTRSIRRFERLMTNRIDWSKFGLVCERVWSGTLSATQRLFKKFIAQEVKSSSEITSFLETHKATSISNVLSQNVLQSLDDLSLLL